MAMARWSGDAAPQDAQFPDEADTMTAKSETFPCYYKILGIPARATREEIRRAFRELALRWHPDRNPDNPRAALHFRRIREAYETLIHPLRRKAYDHRRGLATDGEQAGPPSSHGRRPSRREEIFHDYFGIRLREPGARPVRGCDLRFDLQIPRHSCLEGTHEWIEYARMTYCRTCAGRGANSLRGADACRRCYGKGEIEETCRVRVWIPPGSAHETRLKIPGGGDQLRPGEPPGDLVVVLHLVDDALGIQQPMPATSCERD
jgi:molecular chaperone DnaJ